MKTERSFPRVAVREFEDYSVQLLLEDCFYSGMLGNISEKGLCILIPGAVEIPERSRRIERGNILSRYLEERIEFSGDIIWTAPAESHEERLTLAGVEFDAPLELPVQLTAISMAAETGA